MFYIAEGDSGVGFTHAVVDAMIIRDMIEGRDNPWAALFDPLRFGPAAQHLMTSDAALSAVG